MGRAVISVAPGVYRIPLPHPHLLFSNAYLIAGEPNLLIDAGHFSLLAQEQLQRAFHELRIPVESIQRYLLTDITPDRIGWLLSPQFPTIAASVAAHRGMAHQVLGYGAYSLRFRRELILPLFEDVKLFRRLDLASLDHVLNQSFKAGGRIEIAEPLQGGHEVDLGRRKIRVIETPGSTAGHLSYWLEPDRLLFSGDLGVHEGKELPLMIQGLGGDLGAFRKSVTHLGALPARLLLPANGEPVASTHLAFARLGKIALQHRENLRALLLAGPRGFATLFDFMVLGHGFSPLRLVQKVATLRVVLADLVASGDVEELREDRLLVYRLTPRAVRSSRFKRA